MKIAEEKVAFVSFYIIEKSRFEKILGAKWEKCEHDSHFQSSCYLKSSFSQLFFQLMCLSQLSKLVFFAFGSVSYAKNIFGFFSSVCRHVGRFFTAFFVFCFNFSHNLGNSVVQISSSSCFGCIFIDITLK